MAAHRTMVTVSWALQRTRHGEQPVWMGIALAALLGQIGLPGGGFGHGYGSMADVGLPRVPYPLPCSGRAGTRSTRSSRSRRSATLLENPGGTLDYNGRTLPLPDIRLVYWAGGNPFHHHQDLNRLRRALARPDTIVVHEPFWTATARHADIVLPTTTTLERDDMGAGRNDGYVIAMPRAIIALRRGARRLRDVLRAREASSTRTTSSPKAAPRANGSSTSTTDSASASPSAASTVPEFDEFWAAGEARLPISSDDHTLFDRFRADPDERKLATPSGRIELYSETIAGFGYDDCPGHPGVARTRRVARRRRAPRSSRCT